MERYYDKISASGSKRNLDKLDNSDDLDSLPWDPAERKKISQYLPNQKDEVRRKYLARGPCQPYGHVFQKKKFGTAMRRFNPACFEKYGNWLEYSISKVKAFCLCCYLFRDDIPYQGGNRAFVTEGFSCWKKPEALSEHVGGINSFHNTAGKRCDDLMNQGQSIVHAFYKQGDVVKNEYRIRLNASVDAINTGTGQNQEISLPRPGNTRWGSHYKTLLCLVELFPSVIEILETVEEEGTDDSKRCQAYGLLKYFHTFDYVFYLQLMLFILGVTENLSMALHMKNQDISNAMSLVDSTKRELQKFREDGWDLLMGKVSSFCGKNNANMFVMDEEFLDLRRPRKKTGVTNLHHYKVNCFYTIMDLQLQEFNDRFTEVNTDLLICMASLSPANSFCEFNKSKLLRLVKFYLDDFSFGERLSMEHQLGIYIDNIRNDERFKNLKNLGDLSRLMVETKKHLVHPLVYRLLKLVLTLPIATASVERCFSAMKLVKTSTRNRIGDEFLSDCLVCYIEKELFESVTNETVVNRFQSMRERRIHL